jgi:hypothetical protein
VRLLLRVGVNPFARFSAQRASNPRVSLNATPHQLAASPEVARLLASAELRAQLTPLAAAATRGQLFDARLFDATLWRMVARYALGAARGR